MYSDLIQIFDTSQKKHNPKQVDLFPHMAILVYKGWYSAQNSLLTN